MKSLLTILALTLISSAGFGAEKTRDYKFDPISKLRVSGSFDLEIKQGSSQSVTVTAEEEVIERWMELELKGRTLQVGTTSAGLFNSCPNNCNFKLVVVLEQISDLDIAGSGNVIAENLKVNKLELDIAGSGDVRLSGTAEDFEVEISGSGEIEAYDFIAKNVSIKASGSADANVHATTTLQTKISGSADINYKGEPAKVESKVSGSGTVKKAG